MPMSDQQIQDINDFQNNKDKKKDNTTIFINRKINSLRSRLLDTSRRNPLISSRTLSETSTNFIRIVDFQASTILGDTADFEITETKLEILSLPSLNADPLDENNSKFQQSFKKAQRSDKHFLEEISNIKSKNEQDSMAIRNAKRALKDRIRKQFNMPPRQHGNSIDLSKHARNNCIPGDYETKISGSKSIPSTLSNVGIQTLLLPEPFKKRMNKLLDKQATWSEEYGIHVLKLAYGFLEWQDGNNSSNLYSPILLLPVEIHKENSEKGLRFFATINTDEIEENIALKERLRLEFGIFLPSYSSLQEGIEKYLHQIESLKPDGKLWELHRFASIGIFPSQRLSMYEDLDPETWDFSKHTVLTKLFGEANDGDMISNFANEYDIDEPAVENKVPYLIADADASQYSTIVDVVSGHNTSLEGPPGTGKSQTIVNCIAANLARGKKVLFVAEKSAAINVVRSRLNKFGLGEFILSLQANQSSKSAAFSSIRERVELSELMKLNSTYTTTLDEFKKKCDDRNKARFALKEYRQILSSKFNDTNLTVYQILSKAIKLKSHYDLLPEATKEISVEKGILISEQMINSVFGNANKIKDQLKNLSTNDSLWSCINAQNLNYQDREEILTITDSIKQLYFELAKLHPQLNEYARDERLSLNSIEMLHQLHLSTLDKYDLTLVQTLLKNTPLIDVKEYLDALDIIDTNRKYINQFIREPLNKEVFLELQKLLQIITAYELNQIDPQELVAISDINTRALQETRHFNNLYKAIKHNDFLELPFSTFVSLIHIISNITSHRSLLYLQNSLDCPNLIDDIRAFIMEIENLSEIYARLNASYQLNHLPSQEAILNYADVFRTKGIFSFFSRKYREAKTFYRSIHKEKNFNSNIAIAKLKEIADYLDKHSKFISKYSTIKIDNFEFQGIETNIRGLKEVVTVIDLFDQQFNRQTSGIIKKFINSFDEIEQMHSFAIPRYLESIEKFKDYTLTQIHNDLIKLQDELLELPSSIEHLIKVKQVFINPHQVNEQKLKEILEGFERLLNAEHTLKLNKSFYYLQTLQNIESLKEARDLIILISSLEETAQNAIFSNKSHGRLLAFEELLSKLSDRHKRLKRELERLEEYLNDSLNPFLENKTYQELGVIFENLSRDKDGLRAYSSIARLKSEFDCYGLKSIVNTISSDSLHEIDIILQSIIFRSLALSVYDVHGAFFETHLGNNMNNLVSQFQEADKEVIKYSRECLKNSLYRMGLSAPKGISNGKVSQLTDLSLIKHELSKKKRYIPIRKLVNTSHKALLALKPCWMMSPLTVAQYLPKHMSFFDLVIIDEASQMVPEDAIGAIARSKQVMIVGDTNQLPPTNFFNKVLDDEDLEEDLKVYQESILELSKLKLECKRQLRWHYRSKDPKLIAFSNKHIYGNNLVLFPTAHEGNPETVIFLLKVEGGVYSHGQNTIEAQSMQDEIVKFMQSYPDKSLGVVLLNQKQRDCINDGLIQIKDKNEYVSQYIKNWEARNDGLEAFFIKNLENVQGDERDVIFIGTVYGPEQIGGPVMQRFGPINGAMGKRRLNVLFSRAKEKIVTFSSMAASDIKAEYDVDSGVYMLKAWLEYSGSGTLEGGVATQALPDSEFEEEVISQIKALGHEAIPQIGVKGYSIDIGIKHDDWPHGYLMGVECDGAPYHSSLSARDRDRLRQEILEGLGWKIYRVWSTDWFENPSREMEKLSQAIEERLAELNPANFPSSIKV